MRKQNIITIKDALRAERELDEKRKEMVSGIIDRVNDKISMGAVTYSSLSSSGFSLSPRYHMPSIQAKIVKSALINCNTITELMNKIEHMISNERVVVEGQTERLHPRTIGILKEVLGKEQE